MGEFAIQARNVSKEFLSNKKEFRSLIERHAPEATTYRRFALHNISFDLRKGEILGIIGKNGAGKSTLLRILSAISKPTAGTIRITGSVGSMLEIGAGFSPDLTGRENIYLTGSLIGLNANVVSGKIDHIISLSGLKEHIDRPVKYYSSGMHIRLAFSSLAILETDILILDEISAVGDASFRMKSTDLIRQLTKTGRSIILASHNLEEIQSICNKVLWLDEGKVKFFGEATEAIECYMDEVYNANGSDLELPGPQSVEAKGTEKSPQNFLEHPLWYDIGELPADTSYRVHELNIHAAGKSGSETILQQDNIEIDIIYEKLTDNDMIDFIINLSNSRMVNVLSDCRVFRLDHLSAALPKGRYKVTATIPGNLLNVGLYIVQLAVLKNESDLVCDYVRLKRFRVNLDPRSAQSSKSQFINHFTTNIISAIRPDLLWKVERL